MAVKNTRYDQRRMPIGAEVISGQGVHFRVWAPKRKQVEVVLEQGPDGKAPGGGTSAQMHREKNGYFSTLVPEAGEGSYYRFRLNGRNPLFPDPASRFQPNGPSGASLVVSPERFEWSDQKWPGARISGQVIYEMHIGTLTQEGTWKAAARELPELKTLGATLLEIMPVGDFPGRFGWGYDLEHPALNEEHWEPVVSAVKENLLTPVGLRSLEPGAPDYKPRYFGDLHARDAAYHQGTVWGWLIGPFVDAWLKVHPEDRQGARRFLEGFVAHFEQGGVGSISEVFDADPPFTSRGCIAQAWSVAEVLRCWVKTGV